MNILASFVTNVCLAATENRLFNTSNPGFILSRLSRLIPEEARRVFDAIKSNDSSLAAFALAILSNTFDSYKGQSFSLTQNEHDLSKFVSIQEFEAHAKQRLRDKSVVYPERAAWRSVVERKHLYGVDGSLCENG